MKQNISKLPQAIVKHDKIKLRLLAENSNTMISDAYICVQNSYESNSKSLTTLPKSKHCKGYSAVIIYPVHIKNKVVRSFIGDKTKLTEKLFEDNKNHVFSFPKYDNIDDCLFDYSLLASDKYWINTTIIQEIFDPVYTGIVRQIDKGFLIEITRGHSKKRIFINLIKLHIFLKLE